MGLGRRERREGLGGERGRAGQTGCGLGRRSSEGCHPGIPLDPGGCGCVHPEQGPRHRLDGRG